MGIERPAKAATVPVPEPREPFLQKEEDLGTATGPEGRVPRGQNKIFREETAEEATLRVLRERIPTCTKTVTPVESVWPLLSGTHAEAVPEGREFDPNYNTRQFNNMTATVSDAAADGSPRNHDPRGRPEYVDGSGESKRLGQVSVEGFENCRRVGVSCRRWAWSRLVKTLNLGVAHVAPA